MMKKITLSLFITLCSFTGAYSQSSFSILAPPSNNTTSQFRAPNGTVDHTFQRGCFIIPQSELLPMAVANITTFAFVLANGSNLAVTGNFTLYLQNTTNATYNKGNSFSAALAGMTTVYNNTMTVPNSAGSTVITLTLSPGFNYTGNGLYVAYDWASTGPFGTTAATYSTNSTISPGGATSDATIAPVPDALLNTDFRPCFKFNAANTATNEVSVLDVTAPGKVAKLLNAGHVITADIRNSSIGAVNNISVSLNITGANPFSDSKIIPTIASGAVETVSFNVYNPTVNGNSTMTVSVLPDQVTTNNSAKWTQSVTCNIMGNNPATGVFSNGIGFPNGTGIISNRINLPAAASLSSVRLAIANATANAGKQVYGVLMDGSGNIIATTNTITMTSSMYNTFQSFVFTPSQPMTASTDFLIGLAQPAPGYFPIGSLPNSYLPDGYFSSPLVGGSAAPFAVNFGYFGIEPVFEFFETTIIATASKTLICAGEQVTLNVNGGATTYTWSANAGSSNSISVVATPTLATGTLNYIVNGTHQPSGCKSNASAVTVSVSACTGLASNTSNGYNIKLFPNPSVNGKSTITGLAGTNAITVFNTLGQIVLTQLISDESTVIDLSNQPSGNYLVKITDANKESRLIKVVNQN